ncbi:MAG: hypothetical protein V3571_09815, partial [Pseudodesulfovibrio sp.]
MPELSVQRDGKRSLVVTLPEGVWQSEARPGSKDFPGKLVKSIRVGENSVEIDTRTDGFGFIRIPVPGKPQFLLQIYRDPIGARWEPAKAASASAAAAAPAPKPAPAARSRAETAVPRATSPVTASAVQPVAQADPVRTEADLPPEQGGDRKPFFAVPYSVRTGVAPPPGATSSAAPQSVQGRPDAASPPVPQAAPAGVYPPSSELRFKAVHKTAEEVKFAELAGPQAGGGGTAEPVVAQPSAAESTAAGGRVAALGEPVSAVSGADAASVASGDGMAAGSVAPPPGALPTAQPAADLSAVNAPGGIHGGKGFVKQQ